MYNIATFVLLNLSSNLNNLSASFAESDEVGSSRIKTLDFLTLCLYIAIN